MSDLKRIRIFEKKISQFELSRVSGIHPSRLSVLENDLATPSEKERKRISEALGMSPEELFGAPSSGKKE
jgi:transcriptional regulator with XRE-family HTH domain